MESAEALASEQDSLQAEVHSLRAELGNLKQQMADLQASFLCCSSPQHLLYTLLPGNSRSVFVTWCLVRLFESGCTNLLCRLNCIKMCPLAISMVSAGEI